MSNLLLIKAVERDLRLVDYLLGAGLEGRPSIVASRHLLAAKIMGRLATNLRELRNL